MSRIVSVPGADAGLSTEGTVQSICSQLQQRVILFGSSRRSTAFRTKPLIGSWVPPEVLVFHLETFFIGFVYASIQMIIRLVRMYEWYTLVGFRADP